MNTSLHWMQSSWIMGCVSAKGFNFINLPCCQVQTRSGYHHLAQLRRRYQCRRTHTRLASLLRRLMWNLNVLSASPTMQTLHLPFGVSAVLAQTRSCFHLAIGKSATVQRSSPKTSTPDCSSRVPLFCGRQGATRGFHYQYVFRIGPCYHRYSYAE
jgi:hypothetical protein